MSIFKILQESLCTETRKHGADEYASIRNVIEKYKNHPDHDNIYIHFSNDFTDSKGQLINQIGINTKQDYSNPFGVYAYPIYGIADFKVDAPYAYILKNNNIPTWINNISSLSVSEYKRCMGILKDKYFDSPSDAITFEKETESDADNKSFGGILFYFIIRMSMDKHINKNVRVSLFQTKVWMDDLGYSGVGDKGNGIIHPSEPSQVVWFTPKGYEIIDVIKARTYEYSLSSAIKKGSIDNIEQAIKLSGKINTYDLITASRRGNDAIKVVMDNIDDKKLDIMTSDLNIFDALNGAISNKADTSIISRMIKSILKKPSSGAIDRGMNVAINRAAKEKRVDVLNMIVDEGYKTSNTHVGDTLKSFGYHKIFKRLSTVDKKKKRSLLDIFNKK